MSYDRYSQYAAVTRAMWDALDWQDETLATAQDCRDRVKVTLDTLYPGRGARFFYRRIPDLLRLTGADPNRLPEQFWPRALGTPA